MTIKATFIIATFEHRERFRQDLEQLGIQYDAMHGLIIVHNGNRHGSAAWPRVALDTATYLHIPFTLVWSPE